MILNVLMYYYFSINGYVPFYGGFFVIDFFIHTAVPFLMSIC